MAASARPEFWPPPNTVNPDNKGPMIQGIFIGFTLFAVIVVGLRFWTRVHIIRNVGKDDWMILAATVNLLAATVTNCLVVKYYSFGMHVWDIVKDYGALGKKMDFANQLLYHPILALTKISILLFYHRLSPNGTFRIWVNTLIGINIALTVSIFFADLLQCTPIQFIWDPTTPGGKCMNTKAFFIGSAVLNIISDFAVLLLPIPMVLRLKINTRKKVALISLFSLGGFVCAVSIVRLKAILDIYDTSIKDPTYSTGFFWSGIECSLAIVCASIPSLKPFFTIHFPRLLGSSFGSRYGPNSQGKMYNTYGGGGASRSRSHGYALDSLKSGGGGGGGGGGEVGQFASAAAGGAGAVGGGVKTTIMKGVKRDNESEESIIHGEGIVRTTDVRVEVESIHSAEDRQLGKGIAQ